MEQPEVQTVGAPGERSAVLPVGGLVARFERFVPLLVLSFCAAKLLLLVALALNSQYVMDEYLQGAYSLVIPEGFYGSYDPVKTVLYAYVFRLARTLSPHAVGVMFWARVEGLLLAAGAAFLLYRISRNIGRTTLAALFSVAAFLSFSNVMERSFRVRSDTVAVFFVVAAVWAATRGRDAGSEAALAGVLAGAAFLSTQKAVYGVAAVGLGYAVGLFVGGERRRALRQGALYGTGFVLVFLAYAVYFGGRNFLGVMGRVLLSPLEFLSRGGDFYSGTSAFVRQTLERNAFAYALCAAGVLLSVWRFRELGAGERRVLVAALVLVPAVFLHGQPWPYTFVMAAWPLALFAPDVPRALSGRRGHPALATGACLVVLAASFGRNVAYLKRGNEIQQVVVREAESLLGPEDRYLDGTWMIATRFHAGKVWWDSQEVLRLRRAAKRGDVSELEHVFSFQPKIVILNYRTISLGAALGPYLRDSYVPVSSNILLSGAEVDARAERRFVARWAGRYRPYDPDGKPATAPIRLDGQDVDGDVYISLGPHRVVSNRPDPLLLLPSGLGLSGPLPDGRPPYDLFNGVYD